MNATRQPNLLHRAWHTPMRDLARWRMSARLDWQGVIADAPVPEDVKKRLRKLVRRTRLWRSEKAEVARDLVHHFEDALADGASPDDALERFGDWRRTAKLIRRAQKRNRPIVWHACRWAFWSVIALLVWYAAMGVYYLTGSRAFDVDYVALMNQEAAAVPDADRAWPRVRQSLLAMGYTQPPPEPEPGQTDVRERIADRVRPGDPGWPAVSAFLASHDADLARLRDAASMPGLGYIAGYYEDPADLPLFDPKTSPEQHRREVAAYEKQFADEPPITWMVLLPHLSSLRDAARLLSADSFRAMDARDADAVHANLVALLGLADHANEQNTLVNQLVMVWVRRIAMQTLSEVMSNQPGLLADRHLADLAHRIAKVRVYRPDFTGERAFMDDLFQHIYTDDGKGNGHLDTRAWRRYAAELSAGGTPMIGLIDETAIAPRLTAAALTPAAVMLVADRKTMAEEADRLYALYAADLDQPMWRQPASRGEQALIELIDGPLYRRARYFPIALAMPALGAVRETAERYNAQADGTLVALGLELYRREQNAYPDTLETLVPHYLPGVPIDRITGDPLNYRLIDGRPVLYSVGADRDDDGGAIVYEENGERTRDVARWALHKDEQPLDGDWVVWPLHDERPNSARTE